MDSGYFSVNLYYMLYFMSLLYVFGSQETWYYTFLNPDFLHYTLHDIYLYSF